jgi:phosphatidylserine/phosphatidylglycerophosphate/cardiolipin synthase-like enzyme
MGAEIRYDKMLHARIIIFDDIAAIISSADLDSEGLNNQKQAGILTLDKIVVRDAITFFDKAWEMAEKA